MYRFIVEADDGVDRHVKFVNSEDFYSEKMPSNLNEDSMRLLIKGSWV